MERYRNFRYKLVILSQFLCLLTGGITLVLATHVTTATLDLDVNIPDTPPFPFPPAEARPSSPTWSSSSSVLQLRQIGPRLQVDTSRITLSGFSSGGGFAQILQFSYSSLFQGVAVFAHNYYRCGVANGIVGDYDRACTILYNTNTNDWYNPELVHNDITFYSRYGLIEDVRNLKDKRLYVYAGLRSFVFAIQQSMHILKVYERYIQNPKAIKARVQDSNHLLPTNSQTGVPCTENGNRRSYIGNCGFSGAYEAIEFLVNGDSKAPNRRLIEPPSPSNFDNIFLQPLYTFDQTEFTDGISNHGMDSIGFIYIPSSGCPTPRCLLHFYFHGCGVARLVNGTTHIQNSGYLEMAELNQIVVVFPQAAPSLPNNPNACWDTFGISGPFYATKQGAQVRAVRRMLDVFLRG